MGLMVFEAYMYRGLCHAEHIALKHHQPHLPTYVLLAIPMGLMAIEL